jgi:hypothetical protein
LAALQAPVAGDLRLVVGSMQNVADAERMGGLALHVAKIARRRQPEHALPEGVHGYFAEMGTIAVDLGNSAQEVVLSRDPEQAARISRDDWCQHCEGQPRRALSAPDAVGDEAAKVLLTTDSPGTTAAHTDSAPVDLARQTPRRRRRHPVHQIRQPVHRRRPSHPGRPLPPMADRPRRAAHPRQAPHPSTTQRARMNLGPPALVS